MRSPTALKKSEQEPEGATKNPQNSFLKSISGRLGKILSFARKSELQESIEEILEGGSEAQTPLDAGEKAILKNVLEFKQLHVEDVMIPRADIFAVPEDIQFEDLQHKLVDKTYTRIPVYKGDLDEILGFIHIKDVWLFYRF
jgi:magnesium and cobalt transporter